MYGKEHTEATKKLIGEKCSREYREMLSKAQTPEMRETASKRMKVNVQNGKLPIMIRS